VFLLLQETDMGVFMLETLKLSGEDLTSSVKTVIDALNGQL